MPDRDFGARSSAWKQPSGYGYHQIRLGGFANLCDINGYLVQSSMVKEDVVKLPRISLVSVEFAVLLIAINLGIFRAFEDDSVQSMAYGWMEQLLFLLPMIDVLSIGWYRLWRRRQRTAGAVGFLIAGSVATVVAFGLCVAAPDTTYGAFGLIYLPIAEALSHAITRHLGNAAMQTLAGQLFDFVTVEFLIPMAIYSTPPLLVALSGGWFAHRLSSRPRIVPAIQD